MTFKLNLPEGTDYAKAGNASRLEMDINHFLRREASDELNKAVTFDAKVNRTKFCDHPEDQRQFAEKTEDFCQKCGGPAIEVDA